MAIQPLHEEIVMFDRMVEGFEDQLVIAQGATRFTPEDPNTMAHLGDRMWLPVQPIAAAYDGFDQTSNFGNITELGVPIDIGYHKSVNFSASSKNMRNSWALEQYGNAAKQTLASQINLALFNTAALYGTKFIKRTVAPTGFSDVAQADAALTEIGVGVGDRMMFLAPRVANAMAGDLASRQTMNDVNLSAYEKAMINVDIAGFSVFKNDQSVRLGAATGGATTVAAASYYVPTGASTATTGQTANVDNRTMTLPVTATTFANIKVGDAFTIAGVNSVHKISKQDTGQLQTFRVWGKPSAGNLLISPPIVAGAGGGGSKIEVEQQNVTAAAANGAAITWLNTVTAELNPFFKKEALLLIPGSFVVEPQDGWAVLRATTPTLGIGITYTRQGNINDLSVKGRWDIDFGTSMIQPEMAGDMAFNQA